MARIYRRDARGRFAATGTRTASRNPVRQAVRTTRVPAYTDQSGVRQPESTRRSVALVRGKGVAGRVRAFRLNRDAKRRLRRSR